MSRLFALSLLFLLSACGAEVEVYQWFSLSAHPKAQEAPVQDSLNAVSTNTLALDIRLNYSKVGDFKTSLAGPPQDSQQLAAQRIDTLMVWGLYSDNRPDSLLNDHWGVMGEATEPLSFYEWRWPFGQGAVEDSFRIVPLGELPTGVQRFYVEMQTGSGSKVLSDTTDWLRLE